MMAAAAAAIGIVADREARAQDTPAHQGDARAAYDAAFQAMFADPANLDKAFAFAMIAIRAGDLEGAVATLERMLLVVSNLPRVRLELGVLYFRLKSYDAAHAYLASALEAPDVPPIARERIEKYLAEIDRQVSRHRFSGNIYGGVRYQTNANAGPADALIRVLGFDATLDDSFTEQEDVDAFVASRFQYAYDLGSVASRWLEVDLSFYGAEQATEKQLDTRLAQLRVGPRFEVAPESVPGLEMRPFVTGAYIALDDRKYYDAFGGGLEVQYPWSNQLALDVEATISERTYNDTASSPDNRFLNGPRSALRANARYALARGTSLLFSGAVRREETRSSGENNWEYEFGGTVQHVVPSPFSEFLADPWVMSLSLTGVISRYDAPNPTIAPTVTRNDDEWRTVFVTSVPVREDTALVMTLSYSNVDSNLPNFTYTNLSAALGAVVQF